MSARGLQFLFGLLLLSAPAGGASSELEAGSVYQLTFEDVDGNELSTADGHVTIITVVTRNNEDKARAVADQVPDKYVGDPNYRYVTLVNFQRKLFGPLQGLTRTVIRNRLDAEAKELKSTYEEKHLTRDPRRDIHVIADFNGKPVEQLGLTSERDDIAVFVFDREGKLIARWEDVPPEGELPKAIAAAHEEHQNSDKPSAP
jgi:hypothetical protein